jgi:hypothetical protein
MPATAAETITITESESPAKPLFCIWCAKEIPYERARRGGETCSQHCAYKLRQWTARNRKSGPNSVYELDGKPVAADHPSPLTCIVDQKKIPVSRAARASSSCSQECKDALRQWRLENLREQKCPKCYHPSTAEERESYKQWRMTEYGYLWKNKNAGIYVRVRSQQHFMRKIREYLPAEFLPELDALIMPENCVKLYVVNDPDVTNPRMKKRKVCELPFGHKGKHGPLPKPAEPPPPQTVFCVYCKTEQAIGERCTRCAGLLPQGGLHPALDIQSSR